jgi:hypothetical protein
MIFATERPTVPKPTSAIFRRRSAAATLRGARDFAGFDFHDERERAKESASGRTIILADPARRLIEKLVMKLAAGDAAATGAIQARSFGGPFRVPYCLAFDL